MGMALLHVALLRQDNMRTTPPSRFLIDSRHLVTSLGDASGIVVSTSLKLRGVVFNNLLRSLH